MADYIADLQTLTKTEFATALFASYRMVGSEYENAQLTGPELASYIEVSASGAGIRTGSAFVSDPIPDGVFMFNAASSTPGTDAGSNTVTVVDVDGVTPITATIRGDIFKWDDTNTRWVKQSGGDVDTTYTLSISGDTLTLTPSTGTAQSVTLPAGFSTGTSFPSNVTTGEHFVFTAANSSITAKDTDGTTDKTSALAFDLFQYDGTNWDYIGFLGNISDPGITFTESEQVALQKRIGILAETAFGDWTVQATLPSTLPDGGIYFIEETDGDIDIALHQTDTDGTDQSTNLDALEIGQIFVMSDGTTTVKGHIIDIQDATGFGNTDDIYNIFIRPFVGTYSDLPTSGDVTCRVDYSTLIPIESNLYNALVHVLQAGTSITLTESESDGQITIDSTASSTDTTYTLSLTGNTLTLTPSSGAAQTVTLPQASADASLVTGTSFSSNPTAGEHFLFTSANSSITAKDTDGSTDKTSAQALDLFRYDSTNTQWVYIGFLGDLATTTTTYTEGEEVAIQKRIGVLDETALGDWTVQATAPTTFPSGGIYFVKETNGDNIDVEMHKTDADGTDQSTNLDALESGQIFVVQSGSTVVKGHILGISQPNPNLVNPDDVYSIFIKPIVGSYSDLPTSGDVTCQLDYSTLIPIESNLFHALVHVLEAGTDITLTESESDGQITIAATGGSANTTYTISISGNVLTLTPSSGSAQTVTVPDTDTTYTISVSGTILTLTPSSGSAQSITLPTTVASTSFVVVTALPSNANSGECALFSAAATGLTAKDTDGTTDKTTAQALDLFQYNGTNWIYVGFLGDTDTNVADGGAAYTEAEQVASQKRIGILAETTLGDWTAQAALTLGTDFPSGGIYYLYESLVDVDVILHKTDKDSTDQSTKLNALEVGQIFVMVAGTTTVKGRIIAIEDGSTLFSNSSDLYEFTIRLFVGSVTDLSTSGDVTCRLDYSTVIPVDSNLHIAETTAVTQIPSTDPLEDGTIIIFESSQTSFTSDKTVEDTSGTALTSAKQGDSFRWDRTNTKWVRIVENTSIDDIDDNALPQGKIADIGGEGIQPFFVDTSYATLHFNPDATLSSAGEFDFGASTFILSKTNSGGTTLDNEDKILAIQGGDILYADGYGWAVQIADDATITESFFQISIQTSDLTYLAGSAYVDGGSDNAFAQGDVVTWTLVRSKIPGFAMSGLSRGTELWSSSSGYSTLDTAQTLNAGTAFSNHDYILVVAKFTGSANDPVITNLVPTDYWAAADDYSLLTTQTKWIVVEYLTDTTFQLAAIATSMSLIELRGL